MSFKSHCTEHSRFLALSFIFIGWNYPTAESMCARAAWRERHVEEEAVISSNWIKDKTVRWQNTLNVQKPLAEMKGPLQSWHNWINCMLRVCILVNFQHTNKGLKCANIMFTAKFNYFQKLFLRSKRWYNSQGRILG